MSNHSQQIVQKLRSYGNVPVREVMLKTKSVYLPIRQSDGVRFPCDRQRSTCRDPSPQSY